MAENKKGFMLYADQKELFDQLPDELAGKLIKHIFSYVNDDDPETDDLMLKLAFTPIKLQLKRDLVKWEKRAKRSRDNGSKGGRPKKDENLKEPKKPNGLKDNPDEPKKPDNVNVNVNVNDSNKKESIEKKIVTIPEINEDKKQIFSEWLDYRKEIKKPVKNKKTLDLLAEKFNSKKLPELEFVVRASIENGWQGLFWDRYKPITHENGRTASENFKSALGIA